MQFMFMHPYSSCRDGCSHSRTRYPSAPVHPYRPEHIFMAVVNVMVTVLWILITRKYLQDVFQERNIVYFGGV
jgi:hypothetical protein